MAKNSDNLFTHGVRGAVGKQIVFKKVNGKTIVSKYPDMSQVTYNDTQIKYQNLFAQAVEFAQAVLHDPIRKSEYEKKIHNNKKSRGSSVYHYALAEFIDKNSYRKSRQAVEEKLFDCREKYKLSKRQELALQYIITYSRITNAILQQLTGASKPTVTRDLQDLIKQGAILLHSKGAGAFYSLAELGDIPEETPE